jgi:predicted transglutaminase-like cysteine proteinase
LEDLLKQIYLLGRLSFGSQLIAVALSACANLSTSLPLPAHTAAHPAPMSVGLAAAPPAGLMGFCLKYQSECTQPDGQPTVVALSGDRLRQLEDVQAKVNNDIQPRDVPGHAWDYPTNGTGECNEYALEKRKELIALGWPREALLLTAAYTERGEGHLVLVARTSGGDLVLDNRTAAVLDWSYLPYRWVSQQSARGLVQWVSLTAPGSSGSLLAAAPLSLPPIRGAGTLF